MQHNRTSYPGKKADMYVQLQESVRKYRAVALVRMDKVRASQMLQLRKKLKDEVEFVNIKNKVAIKSLKNTDIAGIDALLEKLQGQCMFMMTDSSPFALNIRLAKSKVMMPARGGDIASVDVEVTARNTGIAPGPMLTEFKEAGIPTKIDQGTIWIAKDTVPVKKGEVISDKLAAMLGKLDIKPIEAGVELDAALEDGLVYSREEMIIDAEAVAQEFATAHQEAVNLSVESAYPTPESIGGILAKASASARSLSTESGYMTDETKESILARAHGQARALVQDSSYNPA